MSTRANIIIKDPSNGDKLFFYRHSDGYPDGVEPTLNKFVDYLKEGKIRNNVGQGAGWLILLGAKEKRYQHVQLPDGVKRLWDLTPEQREKLEKDQFGEHNAPCEPVHSWKVGAYEPTVGLHGDIQHLYIIDLGKMEWHEVPRKEWGDHDSEMAEYFLQRAF